MGRRKAGATHKNLLGYVAILLDYDNPFYSMANSYGYVREHRLVMAQFLGRPLAQKEQVHHLNGVKDDNRIGNLAIVSVNSHQHNTLVKLLQKRIRNLEVELGRQEMEL